MPVKIIRRAKPVVQHVNWAKGFRFKAETVSGTVLEFEVWNPDVGSCLDIDSRRVWFLNAEKTTVHLSTSSSVHAKVLD